MDVDSVAFGRTRLAPTLRGVAMLDNTLFDVRVPGSSDTNGQRNGGSALAKVSGMRKYPELGAIKVPDNDLNLDYFV